MVRSYKQSNIEKQSAARVSLRTLLVFVTLASLGFGFLGSSFSKARKEQAAILKLTKLGAVHDDWFGWRELFGAEYRPIVQVDLPPELSLSDAIEHLIDIDNLEHLGLSANTTDQELAHLKKLYWLESLRISGTRVTDVGLQHLDQLTNLRFLCLEETAVSEKAMLELKKKLPRCNVTR